MTQPPSDTPSEDAPDAAIAAAVDAGVDAGLPGVVAGVTDRHGTRSLRASGSADLGDSRAQRRPMRPDTVLAVYSVTKLFTVTLALALVERGALDLDAPAAVHDETLRDVRVLVGFDASGAPVLRAPRSHPTARHLLHHTAGFGYDFFDPDYRRLARDHGQPGIVTATPGALRTPLLFDPGERWQYGTNIDHLGRVVEGVTGNRLRDVLQELVLGPLGLGDTSFRLDDRLAGRAAVTYRRRDDGTLRPVAGTTPRLWIR